MYKEAEPVHFVLSSTQAKEALHKLVSVNVALLNHLFYYIYYNALLGIELESLVLHFEY